VKIGTLTTGQLDRYERSDGRARRGMRPE